MLSHWPSNPVLHCQRDQVWLTRPLKNFSRISMLSDKPTTVKALLVTMWTSALSTEQDIEAFVTFFRSNFPDATFPPKMHMLEEHVVPFLRRWHFPLGFFGEQGGESIHKDFVQLASTFSHVKPSTMRLKKVLEEHHLVVHPKNRELILDNRIL